MKILVNGVEQDIAAHTLEGVLAGLDYGDTKVATALNGDFVPARKRAETPLREGDRIEIVSPRQGG
jgi:sulfur carrier protein